MEKELSVIHTSTSTLARPILSSRAEFLREIPRMSENDYTGVTNLKTNQWWALQATAFGHAIFKHDGRKVFWKTMKAEKSLLAELDGYRLLRPFFRSDQLHRPVGIDFSTQRIFYDFLEGASTVWELRFSHVTADAGMVQLDNTGKERIIEVILDIESRKNKEILRAYKDSILFSTNRPISAEDKGTSLMHMILGELVLDYKRLLTLQFPSGITAGDCGCTIDEYFSYKFVINNHQYDNLDKYVSEVSKRVSLSTLYNTILAAGFGDGRFGNLMIDAPKIGAAFHFIDYELAGLHNPFCDAARGVYYDCFFTATSLDLLTKPISENTGASLYNDSLHVEINVSREKEQIHVTHNYWDCLTAPGWDDAGVQIFAEKYYNVLLPLVSHLNSEYPEHIESTSSWQELLGHTLFACSAFRTTFSGSQRMFFLNACLGLELLHFREWLEMRFRPRYESIRSARRSGERRYQGLEARECDKAIAKYSSQNVCLSYTRETATWAFVGPHPLLFILARSTKKDIRAPTASGKRKDLGSRKSQIAQQLLMDNLISFIICPGNTARKNFVPLSVTPTILVVRYHYPYAIPALAAALMLLVITSAVLLVACFGDSSIARMRLHPHQVSPVRIYTTLLYAKQGGGMTMKGKDWGEKVGKKVVDLSGEAPMAADVKPPPEKAHSNIG